MNAALKPSRARAGLRIPARGDHHDHAAPRWQCTPQPDRALRNAKAFDEKRALPSERLRQTPIGAERCAPTPPAASGLAATRCSRRAWLSVEHPCPERFQSKATSNVLGGAKTGSFALFPVRW